MPIGYRRLRIWGWALGILSRVTRRCWLACLPAFIVFSIAYSTLSCPQSSHPVTSPMVTHLQTSRPAAGVKSQRIERRRPRIDAATIMRHAAAIVGFGPHPPGSEAQRKVGDYLIGQLKSYRLEVQTQEFQAPTPNGSLDMRNIWAVLPGKSGKTIILASHYDSKYFKDFQFVGANDGASSSAVLLELARVLGHGNPTEHALWFVFFDGEEAIREWSDFDSLYGSREFVKMLNTQQKLSSIGALILLDLVGEKDLSFRRDTNSTPWLVDTIWTTAARLGHSDKFRQMATTMIDDHIPFAQQGVPVVDIIDLEYAYWHTAEDTLDKLSAENMRVVGDVVLNALPDVGAKVSSR